MERLLKYYFKECDFNSDFILKINKIGEILLLALLFVMTYLKDITIIKIIILLLLLLLLDWICRIIEAFLMTIKLNKKCKFKELMSCSTRRRVIADFDKFQKGWISNYLRKNKLDRLEKIKIIVAELDKKESKFRYLDPVIIGTLLLKLWELILNKIDVQIGLWGCIIISAILAVIISVIIGVFRKEYKDHMRIKKYFTFFSGKERLRQLLFEASLKCKK
ncbi:MAG: hypothetical protein IKR04_04085 [Clostridia bacterium]|nr:hypothetical protein [Clostridia bacterium]